jgi:hypothetical protein
MKIYSKVGQTICKAGTDSDLCAAICGPFPEILWEDILCSFPVMYALLNTVYTDNIILRSVYQLSLNDEGYILGSPCYKLLSNYCFTDVWINQMFAFMVSDQLNRMGTHILNENTAFLIIY